MENILITFESDTTGINTGVEGLQQLGKVDENLKNTFNQTNAAIKDRDKLLTTQKSSLAAYSEGLNNAGKAAVGAFSPKVLTDYKNAGVQAFGAIIQQITKLQESKKALEASSLKTDDAKLYGLALQQVNKDLTALYAQLKLASTANPLAPLAQSSNAAAASIAAVGTELSRVSTTGATGVGRVGSQMAATTNSAVSFRTQLRAMQQELSTLAESGATFSDKYQMSFDDLAQAAGDIADQIGDTAERVRVLGSDTANLDAGVEAAQGLAGAFQVVAGASALFGVESADLQQTLVNLNAVMAITQGLQQAQNFLRGQSILRIRAEGIAQGLLNFIQTGSVRSMQQQNAATVENIAVNEAETVALTETTVAATGTAVAMQILRAALIATGIGAIVVLLVTLVSAMAEYMATTDDAAAAQLKLNDALSEAGELLDAEVTGIEDANQRILASMKERNASDNDLSKQEIANMLLVQDARRRSLEDLNKTLEDTKTISELSAEDYKKLTDKQLELESQITQGETALLEKRSDLQVKYYQDSLKNLQAYAAARATIASEKPDNLAEQLAANIALSKADATVQLANANLTAGERYKIEVDLQKKIDDLKQQYHIAQLTKEKNNIDAQAAMARIGSEEEFNAHLAQLNIQKQIDLANAKDNNTLIGKINAEFYANQAKLIKGYNFQVAQSALETHKVLASEDITNLQMANYSDLSDQMVAAKKKLIEAEANLEVLSINNSENNEQLRKSKIDAVYAKELQDKQALEKAKLKAELDNQSNNVNSYYTQQSNALSVLTQNFQQFGSARKSLDDAMYKNSAENIARQRQLLEQQLAGSLISVEDYNNKYADLDQQHNDAVVSRAEAAYQRKIALAEDATAAITQIEQSFFQGQINRIESEKSANQDLLNNKEITQREYNKRQANLQKQESALKKEQALFEILIDGAKQIFKIEAAAALQTALLNPVGAAIALSQIPFVLVQEGIAAAFVAAQKFKKGGYTGNGGVDDEVGIVHGQEFVAHAGATRKHRAALEAMNQGLFEQYLQKAVLNGEIKLPELGVSLPEFQIPHFAFDIPDIHLTPITDSMMHSAANHSSSSPIDYDKLAEKVSEAIVRKQGKYSDVPRPYVNVDENGLRAFLEEGNKRTEYVNRRYKLD